MARPEVKPGDSWTYRRTELDSGKVTGQARSNVVFVNANVIQVVVTRASGGEADETYTADWGSIATADGSNFTPSASPLKFPMAVGDSHPVVFENTIPRFGAFRVRHERTSRVVGWEDVDVPAGRFHALKVEMTGTFQRFDQSISGTATTTVWYVPQVKRWVKWIYEDRTFRGRGNWWKAELVEYKVQ